MNLPDPSTKVRLCASANVQTAIADIDTDLVEITDRGQRAVYLNSILDTLDTIRRNERAGFPLLSDFPSELHAPVITHIQNKLSEIVRSARVDIAAFNREDPHQVDF